MFLCLLFWITNRFQLLPRINRIAKTVKSKLPIFNRSLDFAFGEDSPITPLTYEVYKGNLKKVEALLKSGADINEEGISGLTPLVQAIFTSNDQMITFLLKNGAEINKVTFDGCTPILFAIENNDIEVLKCLIEHGADVNFSVKEGWTPITRAIANNNTKIVQILISNGANINQEVVGRSPLALAVDSNKEMIKLLVENGAGFNDINEVVETHVDNPPFGFGLPLFTNEIENIRSL